MIRIPALLALVFAGAVSAFGQTVSSESATVIDAASGKVLWSRNGDEELYPASTTKIMTALLLMEHCTPDEVIVAPGDVQKVREASMNLKPGERVRAKDMLYALMLRSANDGCYAVACHISGSVPAFADLMNQRAKELGCTHTHFNNPNGLNDPLHYTTAHDLALIARKAMEYPQFRDIVKTEKIKINRGTNWKDLWMVNHNKILFHDVTCDGIKTGWTIPAGHCFVGSAVRDGWRVITVVMKSKHWQKDTENLFDWAYGTYQAKAAASAGQALGEVNVLNGTQQTIKITPGVSAYSVVSRADLQPLSTKLEVPSSLSAPIERNQKVGDLVIRDPDGFEHKVDVVSAESVQLGKPALIAKSGVNNNGKMVIGAGLLAGAIFFKQRTRKRFFPRSQLR
jgi:D-alanyl-D-alanine carboxypeptidase (penicillin-binding protein 5/6)